MKTYKIIQDRSTLHGTFSKDTKPILYVDSGDSIVCSVMDGDWHLAKPSIPRSDVGEFFTPRHPVTDFGHAMIGPIFVKGAKPGMTLAVRINETRPANWGWSRVGGADNDHTRRLSIAHEEELYLNWDLDLKKMIGTSHMGHVVKLAPFIGVIGVAPKQGGLHPTHPPTICGGNFDCKSIVVGSTVYLPIFQEGALLSVGDGHAAQGDGELGGTAIECPMDRVDLTLTVEQNMQLTSPRVYSPEGWITFGFDESLTDAAYKALEDMTLLIMQLYGITRKEALAYTSLVVDMRVTQIVNGVRGVHAVLPHGVIK